MKNVVSVSCFFLFLCFSVLTIADRGMVPVKPDVSIYEPGQKAIIAWNKGTEVLILSTDVRASDETEVLEIVPLPSNPLIEKGNFSSFEVIQKLIDTNIPLSDKGRDGEGDVEIIFHQKIGLHEITVVKANDYDEFVRWSEDFTKGKKISFPSDLRNIVGDYIRENLRYFVFDLIEIREQQRSINPLIYEFETSCPFYPLKISTLMSGVTEITLFLITDIPLTLFYDERVEVFEFSRYIPSSLPIEFRVSKESLEDISGKIASLFPDSAWLNLLSYRGNLKELTMDFRAEKLSVPTNVEITNCATFWGKIKD